MFCYHLENNKNEMAIIVRQIQEYLDSLIVNHECGQCENFISTSNLIQLSV